MSDTTNNLVLLAKEHVTKCRAKENIACLAEALENLASTLLKEANLIETAASLEEAAELWSQMCNIQRQGSCLLLAASTRRLAGDLPGAKHDLELGWAANLPEKLQNGLEMEHCEQELAHGQFENAYQGFTRILKNLEGTLEPIQKAQLYQRRAASATAAQRQVEAAADFLTSSTIFKQQGFHSDAETSALAAAAILGEKDTDSAERVLAEIYETVPTDGAAATRRGLVGGKIAMQAGNPALALKRFDKARQGSLDVGDPIAYCTAAIEASRAAESIEHFEIAYARLATAWVSLLDILGSEQAAQMVRPALKGLRDRLGVEHFAKVKQVYEERQKHRWSKGQETPTTNT